MDSRPPLWGSSTGESATSDILLKILLEKRLGITATRVRGEPDLEEIGKSYEGVLYIGDTLYTVSEGLIMANDLDTLAGKGRLELR